MAAAQTLLLLPALSLPLSTPRTLTLAPSLLAARRLSLSLSARAARCSARGGVAVVRYSAVESELEQDEEEGEREREPRDGGFSPDLKLFVGNLPFSVDSAKLAGLFESAGTVEMVEVIYDKQTGQSRGFGFVTMSSIEEVEAAAQQFNGYELGGRPLRVNAGPPPPRDEAPSRGYQSGGGYQTGGGRGGGGGGGGGGYSTGNRVYVGNLSWGVDNASLETLFNEQGSVVEAKVVYDRETGRSRGFGFVTYNSADEVNNAISSLDGAELDGRNIRVSVAEERPRRQF